MQVIPDSFLIKEVVEEIRKMLEGEPIFALDFEGENILRVDVHDLSVVQTKLWARFQLGKATKHNCRTPKDAAAMVVSLATAMRNNLFPAHRGESPNHFHHCPLCALFVYNVLHFLVVLKSLDISQFCEYEKYIPTIRPYVRPED